MASAGRYASLHCPSCRPTNSVKALKASSSLLQCSWKTKHVGATTHESVGVQAHCMEYLAWATVIWYVASAMQPFAVHTATTCYCVHYYVAKMLQMVSTSQSATPQLAGFHLAALPRAAIQLAGAGGGPQVLMLCPQSQQQQQQQPVQNSPLSSVIPVMVAASNSQQLASSK